MTAPRLSLQEISDRIEIQDLLTRYALAIDTKDWALLDTRFVEGAQIDYTSTGGKKGPYSVVRPWLQKVLAVTMHNSATTSARNARYRGCTGATDLAPTRRWHDCRPAGARAAAGMR